MSSSESELILAFREEMRAGFAVFATEMRTGFADFTAEMREGLGQVSNRLDLTNELLLETRTEMSSKLTGISNFLILSEESHNNSDKRFDALEVRVQKLEKDKKRQS